MISLLLLLALQVPGGSIECRGQCDIRVVYEQNLAPKGINTRRGYVIQNDGGGLVDRYARKYAALKNSRIVVDGRCSSACTMVLSNPRACATPRAVFGFHSAYDANNGARSEQGNSVLMSHYPPRVREAIRQRGGLASQMFYIRGTELLPTC